MRRSISLHVLREKVEELANNSIGLSSSSIVWGVKEVESLKSYIAASQLRLHFTTPARTLSRN